MYTIFHNPRCSKSRQALSLLEEQGITPEIRLYLKDPLSIEEMQQLLALLKISPRELLRTNEQEYKLLSLNDPNTDETSLVEALVSHPKLMERPIVVKGRRAVVARPPEKVLELI